MKISVYQISGSLARESWPNKGAKSMAAGADSILENIQVFESIPEALHDVSYTVSLTARNRDITKIEFGPEHAVKNTSKRKMRNQPLSLGLSSQV